MPVRTSSRAPLGMIVNNNINSNNKNDPESQRLYSLVASREEVISSKMQRIDFNGKPLEPHKELVEGKLANGFSYIILPNSQPGGWFEAHLEVMSGSALELDPQQGMAHLVEHCAYMGSPKRQLISGTGSRTNAYTDFHHTVFFASCPSETPGGIWKKPMLPMAFDALLDVMTAKIDDIRLEKERAALSELTMVNKMEYRVECQILSALHSENRISYRFPIGKENLIKQWSKEDVQMYHNLHYRPDNVVLYVVGDVDVDTTIKTINEKFGKLQPKTDTRTVLKESGEFPSLSMQAVSRHFPPVLHRWSCAEDDANRLIPATIQRDMPAPVDQKFISDIIPTPRIFKHELMQSFSFHLFAKRPIEPIVTEETFRRELIRRMCLSALQIRFNVGQRQDPLFTFVDFNQINWPREGCAVCSLDLTTDPSRWREAIIQAVHEVRRLGLYGITKGELERYKQAILSEADQSVAQMDQITSEVCVDSCGRLWCDY
jgi:Peptidase M16 inactive domain/Insulinase (Peptidase family M16)